MLGLNWAIQQKSQSVLVQPHSWACKNPQQNAGNPSSVVEACRQCHAAWLIAFRFSRCSLSGSMDLQTTVYCMRHWRHKTPRNIHLFRAQPEAHQYKKNNNFSLFTKIKWKNWNRMNSTHTHTHIPQIPCQGSGRERPSAATGDLKETTFPGQFFWFTFH